MEDSFPRLQEGQSARGASTGPVMLGMPAEVLSRQGRDAKGGEEQPEMLLSSCST